MADITRRFGIRHLRSGPTRHIRHLRRGEVAHEGVGIAFWFRPLPAALSEVPIDDREVPLLFHARTADFQDLSVQATVTYRVADPGLAAARIDFGLDPGTGQALPGPSDGGLVWFVRWPSSATGTSQVEGMLRSGDGMEADLLTLRRGQAVTVRASRTCLRLACRI